MRKMHLRNPLNGPPLAGSPERLIWKSTPMPLGSELATTEPVAEPLFTKAATYWTPGGLPVVTGAVV